MIRLVAIASLSALLLLVLYLPSAHPPEHFIVRMRIEHEQTAAFWSPRHAQRILARTLDAQAAAQPLSPIPTTHSAPQLSGVDSAAAREMSAVNTRLFDSPYFRAIDALLLLATYRFFTLLEWLPWLLAFGIAATVDGAAVRAIKAKQFAHHDPEIFALYACGAIVLGCATVVSFVLPATLPAALLPTVAIVVGAFIGGALAHFHHRG